MIKARYQDEQFRYEARFNKVDDNWGGVSWKADGNVKQWEKKNVAWHTPAPAPAVVAKVEPPPPAPAPAPAPAPTPTRATAATEAKLKFSGFIDLRFSSLQADENPKYAATGDHAEGGFGLEDGAIYANYENDKLTVVADLPFRRAYDADEKAAGTATTQSNQANFRLGGTKSQLYAKYKVADDTNISLGQFDTLYGVELNDSKDRVFGTAGLVNAQLMPVVHMGVMADYNKNGFAAKVFAANPSDKGTNGNTTDNNSEYGTALGFSNDNYRVQAGYMTRSITGTDGERGARNLIDVTAGATFGNFTIDVEYTSVDDPSKDALSAAATDDEDPAKGMFALVTYKFSDLLILGARYENVKDIDYLAGATDGIENVDSIGVSVRSKVSSDIELRAEYITYDFEQVGNADWDDKRFNVASVITF